MAITLNDFRRISNGTYNAGHIDFVMDDKGKAVGLKKVNNHVTFTSWNDTEIDCERVVKMKETFVSLLEKENDVSPKVIEAIRRQLGIADEKVSIWDAGAALHRRFAPLTRQQVREILNQDLSAKLDEGFIEEEPEDSLDLFDKHDDAFIEEKDEEADGADGASEASGTRRRDKYAETRERTNRAIDTLTRKSPLHEMFVALLSGKSYDDAVMAAVKSMPTTAEIENCLRANPNDREMRRLLESRISKCRGKAVEMLAALRVAVTDLVVDPEADEPQTVRTPIGTVSLTLVGQGENLIQQPSVEASFKMGNETFTIDLGVSAEQVASRLDRQIAKGADSIGKVRLGWMLHNAGDQNDRAEGSDPCLVRTAAKAVLHTFAGVSTDYLDTLSNLSLVGYADDVINGTAMWTEAKIKADRSSVLDNTANVKGILDVSNEISDDENNEIIDSFIEDVKREKEEKEGIENDRPMEELPDILKGGDDEKKVEEQPNAEDLKKAKELEEQQRKLKEAEARRKKEGEIFASVSKSFDLQKDGSIKPERAEKAFEAIQKTEKFRFAEANLAQGKRKEFSDFALALVRAGAAGDVSALKALVAANLPLLMLMAADSAGAAEFFPKELFPPKATAGNARAVQGFVESLAAVIGNALKAVSGRTIDFQSFTKGDEDAVRAMFLPKASDAVAVALKNALRERVSAVALLPSDEEVKAAGEALGGASPAELAAFARKNPLALVAFALGDGKVAGRNATQTAEIKAAVLRHFREATGADKLADMTLAEFGAFAETCAAGAFDRTFEGIAQRNAVFAGDLYKAVGGSDRKRLDAAAAPIRTAPPKLPETAYEAEAAAKEIKEAGNAKPADGLDSSVVVGKSVVVGGVTMHVADLLDPDAPHPRNATAADLRGLAADLLEAAESVAAKGKDASVEAIRAVILKDIDAFCRFVYNPKTLGDAVMPQLRGLVSAAMEEVRRVVVDAAKAASREENLSAADYLRKTRPVELKQFVASKMDEAALGGVAAAFAKLADESAGQLQAFVNGVCRLDPNVKIVSEYDGMKPADIAKSLANKTLDDIIDDPITNPSRPGLLAFQKKVLSTYFLSVSHERKAEVLTSALRNAPETANEKGVATETKFLSAVLLGAGPLMQKVLQGIDRRIAGEHGEAFNVLKSSIPPISHEYVMEKLREVVKNNPKYKEIANETKPYTTLGAATVGQTVLTTFTINGLETETVIVKIQRPGVKERFDEDVKIFDAVAEKVPAVRKVWAERVKTIEDEFDFRIEADNIKKGQVYEVFDNRFVTVLDKKSGKMKYKIDPDTGDPEIKPEKLHTYTVSAMKTPEGVKQTKDVLVGTAASGEAFDKVVAKHTARIRALFAGVFETDADGRILYKNGKPVVRARMNLAKFYDIYNGIDGAVRDLKQSNGYLKQAIWKWIEEALFNSGVMHNDVHMGNLVLDANIERITFVDFGNVVELTPEDRVFLLKLVATVAAKHSKYFIEMFGELLGKGTPERRAFESKEMSAKVKAVVEQVISKGLAADDTGYRFQALLSELHKLGVHIPAQVAAFVEGILRLQNCHEEIAGELTAAKELFAEYERQVLSFKFTLDKPDDDDAIGQFFAIMVRRGGPTALSTADATADDMILYDARLKAYDLIYREGQEFKGTLVDGINKAIGDEDYGAGNAKIEHLVSLITRHADEDYLPRIDKALAQVEDLRRRRISAKASGNAEREKTLSLELGNATMALIAALDEAHQDLFMAVNDGAGGIRKPPREVYRIDSAAKIFAQIVDNNEDAVVAAFTKWGGVSLARAMENAKAADKKHLHDHDGHRRGAVNKL